MKSRARPYNFTGGTDRDATRSFSQCTTECPPYPRPNDYFVAEDEVFLDAVAAALHSLTVDCKNALQWSLDDADVEAAIQATEKSFNTIAVVCKEAGLAVSTVYSTGSHECVARQPVVDAVGSPCSKVSKARESILSWSNASVENELLEEASHNESATSTTIYPPLQQINVSPTEEMVEVELTDLLTQTHEHALNIQHALEARMNKAEQAREEHERNHAEEMQALQGELINSRSAVDRMKQELLEGTNRKLEEMHSAITASQKAIEAGMKDQARYWKSICQELVVEKREMAQKVAEERGKYTALKAHLSNHDDPGANSRVLLRDIKISKQEDERAISNTRLCELSPPSVLSRRREFTTGNQDSIEEPVAFSSSYSSPTPRIVAVPSADSASEASSAEVSPTHSNSSSRSSKSTFRRYYLAQKRVDRVVLH